MHSQSQQLADELCRFLRQALDIRPAPLFVALDGRSGSGKSTIAQLAATQLNSQNSPEPTAVVIEGDTFYAGGSNATWDRCSTAAKVDGGIDWRRQRQTLLELRSNGVAHWQSFDWTAPDWDADPTPLTTRVAQFRIAPIVILEGAYSARPELADLMALRILVSLPRDARRLQLRAREGEAYQLDWEARWTAAEDEYFGNRVPESAFDLVLSPT